jgi:von Willebrand factor type A domain-containing protein
VLLPPAGWSPCARRTPRYSTIPFVRLSWDPENDGLATRTAAEFGRWLGTDEGKRAVRATGLHTGSSRPARLHSPAPIGSELDRALKRAVAQAMEHYQEVTRPVTLLLAVDTSGSMASRSALAAAVLNDTADRLSDSDQLGLLSFGGGPNGVRDLVPTARPGAPSRSRSASGSTTAQVTPSLSTREAVRDSLARLRPAGGTPLLRGIDHGVRTLLALPPDPGRPAGVDGLPVSGEPTPIRALAVLTDGEDTVGGPTPIEVVAEQAERGGVQVFVVTVGTADCSNPALQTITTGSGGSCLVAKNGAEASAAALTSAIWGVSGE